jgi:hypothetical protein
MQERSPADILVQLMPYSLVVLQFWVGAAMTWRARRAGIRPWWAYGALLFSLTSQSVLVVRFLGSAEPDAVGQWIFGASYVMFLAIPIVLLVLGTLGLAKDGVTLTDLAFSSGSPVPLTGDRPAQERAPTPGSATVSRLVLGTLIALAATSLLGVLLQRPGAPLGRGNGSCPLFPSRWRLGFQRGFLARQLDPGAGTT